MQVRIKTPYIHDELVEVAFSQYVADKSLSITLHDADDGERIALCTACLTDYGLKPRDGHVFIKNYSENKGMVEALGAAGICEPRMLYEIGPHGAPVMECELSQMALNEATRQIHERLKAEGR